MRGGTAPAALWRARALHAKAGQRAHLVLVHGAARRAGQHAHPAAQPPARACSRLYRRVTHMRPARWACPHSALIPRAPEANMKAAALCADAMGSRRQRVRGESRSRFAIFARSCARARWPIASSRIELFYMKMHDNTPANWRTCWVLYRRVQGRIVCMQCSAMHALL